MSFYWLLPSAQCTPVLPSPRYGEYPLIEVRLILHPLALPAPYPIYRYVAARQTRRVQICPEGYGCEWMLALLGMPSVPFS